LTRDVALKTELLLDTHRCIEDESAKTDLNVYLIPKSYQDLDHLIFLLFVLAKLNTFDYAVYHF
jgi:hypothetical protein